MVLGHIGQTVMEVLLIIATWIVAGGIGVLAGFLIFTDKGSSLYGRYFYWPVRETLCSIVGHKWGPIRQSPGIKRGRSCHRCGKWIFHLAVR